ncbi:MAG: ABC transporter substrate-binding protein [Oscillospiraceae bacterium]|nr:ABC transporter substrate-binding protein [Oscillospiraceae bacterium]
MKKLIAILLMCLIVVSIVAGCGGNGNGGGNGGGGAAGGNGGGGGDAGAGDAGGTQNGQQATGRADIRIATQADIVSLDPHATNDAPSGDVNRQIYSSLLYTGTDMQFRPDLALSWENLSPTEWQFNLRPDVVFHDGTPFTASDVRFSILRQQQFPQVQHLVAAIADVHVVDDLTVIIETHEPFGPILANLSHNATRMLSERAVTYFGDAYAENPIGTGPMRFVSWTPGVEVVLERFEDYFGGVPMAERLTFVTITDGPARTIALETGEVDMVLVVEHVDVDRINNHADLVLEEISSNRIEWLSFNLNRAPFDNVLVRRAIAHALDRESLNIVGYMGRAQIAHSFTGPTVFGYNPNIERIEFNPDLARELLAEAGFPDGFNTTIWSSGEARNRKAQTIQSNLRDIGIIAEIEQLEWAAYLDRTSAGEHYMHLLGWANLTGDADPGMWPLYHTSSWGAGNRAFFSHPRVDQLLEMGRTETNVEARPPLYHEVQEILREYLNVVPLHILPVEFARRADLQGAELHPGGLHRLHNLHFPG